MISANNDSEGSFPGEVDEQGSDYGEDRSFEQDIDNGVSGSVRAEDNLRGRLEFLPSQTIHWLSIGNPSSPLPMVYISIVNWIGHMLTF